MRALSRSLVTEKATREIREMVEQQNEEMQRSLDIKEQDLRASRAVEAELLQRVERLENENRMFVS